MTDSTKLNLAETFYSIKGEGLWQGAPMYFVRLAGCNVGRLTKGPGLFGHTRTGSLAETCTAWDGSKFLCDTDYNRHMQMTVTEILQDMEAKAGPRIKHVVLTGGEPLMPANSLGTLALARSLGKLGITMHIETNGTYPIPMFECELYIACSPKEGWLPDVVKVCDELRLLISRGTMNAFPPVFLNHPHVLLSPVNPATGFDQETLDYVLELLKDNPTWRLNLQLHKYLGVL